MSHAHICASSYRFRFSHFLPSKSRSTSRSAIFANYFIRRQIQNLQMSPTHFFASSYRFRDIIKFKIFDVQKWINVTECNIRKYTVRWQMLKSTHVSYTLLCQLSPFHKYKITNFSPSKKQVKATECKFLRYTIQWHMSKYINASHKFLNYLLSIQRYKHFLFVYLKKSRSRSQAAIVAITPIDGEYMQA